MTSHDQTPLFPDGCWGTDLKAEVFLPLNLTAPFKNSSHQYFSAVKKEQISEDIETLEYASFVCVAISHSSNVQFFVVIWLVQFYGN